MPEEVPKLCPCRSIHCNSESKSNKIEDSVFWYKANPELPEFRVGRQIFWEMHDQYFCDKEDENEMKMLMEKNQTEENELRNKNTRVVKANNDGKTVINWQNQYD